MGYMWVYVSRVCVGLLCECRSFQTSRRRPNRPQVQSGAQGRCSVYDVCVCAYHVLVYVRHTILGFLCVCFLNQPRTVC